MATLRDAPLNFRLVLPDQSRGPVLYRSANPDLADEQTVSRWIEQLGIRTIVDLRNPAELQPYVGDTPSPLAARFPVRSLAEIVRPDRQPYELGRININTTDIAYRIHMFRQFSWRPKLMVVYLFLKSLFTGDRTEMELYGAQELFNRRSQSNLYCSFIDHSRTSISEVFRVLCSENAYGILINCNAGKDRTGIVSALVMDLLGCDRQKIVEEYHKSEVSFTDLEPAFILEKYMYCIYSNGTLGSLSYWHSELSCISDQDFF